MVEQDKKAQCEVPGHAETLMSDWDSSAVNPMVFRPNPCNTCPNNPQNGGSGMCSCTLSPYGKITC